MPLTKDGKPDGSSIPWVPGSNSNSGSALSQIIGTAGSAIGGAISQARGRKKQRDWELQMYERQLSDNRKNWEMENLYNSPAQQMQRLKEAGLNPNLFYGNSANAMGGSINSTDAKVSDLSQNYGAGVGAFMTPISTLNTIYDLNKKKAETDLLTKRGQTEEMNALLRMYQAVTEDIRGRKGEQDMKYYADNQYNLFKNIQLGIQEKLADIQNTKADTRLKLTSEKLGGSRKQGQDIQNALLKLEQDLYEGKLGVPGSGIDKILKLIQPLLLLLKSGK